MNANPRPRDRPRSLPTPVTLAVIVHGDDPATVAYQPRPLDTEADYLKATCEIVTHIRREWTDGDSGPGGRCTRCFSCVAKNNVCRIMVNRYVSRAEAPDFSPRALGTHVGGF
jgi:hypothetical protein